MSKKKDWFKIKQFIPMEFTLYMKTTNSLGFPYFDVRYVGIDPYGNICGCIALTDCGTFTANEELMHEIDECYSREKNTKAQIKQNDKERERFWNEVIGERKKAKVKKKGVKK